MSVRARQRPLLAVTAATALGLAAFAYADRTPPAFPGGPFGQGPGGGGVGGPVDVGKPFSSGLVRLTNGSDVTAEIREVALLRIDPGLRFLGALIFRGHSQLGSARGFPPKLPMRRNPRFERAVGARVEPGEFGRSDHRRRRARSWRPRVRGGSRPLPRTRAAVPLRRRLPHAGLRSSKRGPLPGRGRPLSRR